VAGARLGLDVPIRQILAKDYGAFSPEDVETLAAAFEAALGNLGLVDRNDPATELVAQVVIRLAKEGERDPKRLAEKATGVVRGCSQVQFPDLQMRPVRIRHAAYKIGERSWQTGQISIVVSHKSARGSQKHTHPSVAAGCRS
jgi:hypothetical protein